MSFSVGDWTRPTLMKSLPSWRAEREKARQRGAPDEGRLSGAPPRGGQVEVDVVRVREGVPDLSLGDRGEAHAFDGDVRLVADQFVRFLADEFPSRS